MRFAPLVVIWSVILVAPLNGQIRDRSAALRIMPTPDPGLFTRMQVYSLRHLSEILVDVQTSKADEDVRNWIAGKELKRAVEARLRKAGLTVVDAKKYGDALTRIPILQFHIYTRKHPSGGYLYALNVFLQEGVILLRDRKSTLLGATWTATVLRYLASAAELEKIAGDLDGAVTLFLTDPAEPRRLYRTPK